MHNQGFEGVKSFKAFTALEILVLPLLHTFLTISAREMLERLMGFDVLENFEEI